MRTHLAIGIALVLLILPGVTHKVIFISAVLVASLLPDVDSGFSTFGKRALFRPVQVFVKHRGIMHSLTFAIVFSVVFAFYYPVLALPFFLGYAGHIFADSFTTEGVVPFWPFKKAVVGGFRTGGRVEDTIFIVLIIVDALLLISLLIR